MSEVGFVAERSHTGDDVAPCRGARYASACACRRYAGHTAKLGRYLRLLSAVGILATTSECAKMQGRLTPKLSGDPNNARTGTAEGAVGAPVAEGRARI